MATPPASAPPAAEITAALNRLWVKFLPEIENRLTVVEAAVKALDAGTLTEEQREAAHQAAHKLAGVLGTFGLHRGTEIAREAELMFAGEISISAAAELAPSQLSERVAELRGLIDRRK